MKRCIKRDKENIKKNPNNVISPKFKFLLSIDNNETIIFPKPKIERKQNIK